MTSGVCNSIGRSPKRIDRTGTRNGRLVFIEDLGLDKHKHTVWLAKCDCGNETKTSSPHQTMSCGCLRKELAADRARKRALPIEEKKRRQKENAKRQRERRRKDPRSAMQARLSRLHRHALSQVNAIKTSPTFEQLGYTPDEFVTHIERQFIKGMGWHNMSEWQIDHIIPCSTAKTLDDVIALNQLTNLRPMWASDNNAKKDRLETLL